MGQLNDYLSGKSCSFCLTCATVVSLCRDKTELNDLRKITCSRKSEVSVERISVCGVIETLMKHGIQSDATELIVCISIKHISL